MDNKDSSSKDFTDTYQKQNIYFPYFIKLNQFSKMINNQKNAIRLGLSSNNNLIIEYYIENDPNNTFHKIALNIKDAYNLNKIFEPKKSIEEVYNDIYDILQKGDFDIKYHNESNNTINIILFKDKENINIILNRIKISLVNEYNFELN
jgi:hypothetical protein